MRALTIVPAVALTLSALTACSAQPEGSPPPASEAGGAATGGAGQTASVAGTPSVSGGGASAIISSGGEVPAGGSSSTGSAGAPPLAAGGAGATGAPPVTGGSCASTKVGAGMDGIIDNFETHPASALIPASDNRVGGWWISINQASGALTIPAIPKTGGGPLPVAGGMGGGMALHFAGTDSNPTMGWGADASVALAAKGNCYDASAYAGGLKLSMMGKGSVYVSIITAQDQAASATSGNQRKEVAITSTWADYTIPWAELMTGWGNPIPLDLTAVFAIDVAPSATSAVDFDIWIDNVQFVK